MTIQIIDTVSQAVAGILVDGISLRIPASASILVTDVPGPVSFLWDGKYVKVERGAPFYINGDVNGAPIPFDGLTPGNHVLNLITGPNQDYATLNLTINPPLPAVSQLIAGPDPRGVGIYVTKGTDFLLQNQHVEGFETNISYEHVNSVTLNNVRTINAYRGKPSDSFVGQGLYLDDIKTPVQIKEFYANYNGWQPSRPLQDKTQFRHNIYSNFGSLNLNVSAAIFANAANCGLQARGGLIIENAFFYNNAAALILVMGGFTLRHCTIYGGTFRNDVDATGKILDWTSNIGIWTYYPAQLDDVWIIGRPNQAVPPTPIKSACMGAVMAGGDYPKAEWKPPTDANGKRITKLITATNCRIAGWPGPAFTGHDGSGFTVTPNPVAYDPTPVFAAIEANQISISEAVTKLHSDVRGLVK